MEIHNLTQINFCFKILENIDNNYLKNCILSSSKRMSKDVTDTRFEDFVFPSTPTFELLIDTIKQEYKTVFKQNLKLINYWSQIHLPNESTNLHNHINDNNISASPTISGVYYVSVPINAGKLVFEYPINQYQNKRYYLNPKIGQFVLFPATLNHFVTKNLSNEKRIAISFNFNIEKN
jgi:hypothetical protein